VIPACSWRHPLDVPFELRESKHLAQPVVRIRVEPTADAKRCFIVGAQVTIASNEISPMLIAFQNCLEHGLNAVVNLSDGVASFRIKIKDGKASLDSFLNVNKMTVRRSGGG
jgi:hypothetical protein